VKRGIECLRSGCVFAHEDPADEGFVTCLLELTDGAALAATVVPDDLDQVRAEGESLTSR
jgi:hypothetical protein